MKSLETRNGEKYHFFSISEQILPISPWTNGTIYFLPLDSFQKASHEIVSFDEWISAIPVKPIAKLHVSAHDFPFTGKVSSHNSNERLIVTWLLYKLRCMKQSSNYQ